MEFKEVIPGEPLRPYVRSYFIFESDPGFVLEDNVVFPGGFMEIVFNLGESVWRTEVGGVISEVSVATGDAISEGDVIAVIDTAG